MVTRLDDDDLRLSDLGQFSTVVLGGGHTSGRPGGVNLGLEYVRRGGTLVVQYHNPPRGSVVRPYPSTWATRGVDETAQPASDPHPDTTPIS